MEDQDLAALPEMSEDELSAHNGTSGVTTIYIGVDGRVFDVTSGKGFYGPDGAYHVFAGRDATRALAIGSTSLKDVNGDKSGLSNFQLMKLDDWLDTFESKYPVVARLVPRSKL